MPASSRPLTCHRHQARVQQASHGFFPPASETSPRRLPARGGASRRPALRAGAAAAPPGPPRPYVARGATAGAAVCAGAVRRISLTQPAARWRWPPRGAAPAVELAASESGAPGKGARAGPAGEAVLHQIFGSPPLVPQPHLSSPAGVLRVAAAARGRAGGELMAAGWAPGDGGAAERAGGVAGARTLPRSSSRRASTTARSTSSAWSAMGESVI